MHVCSHLSLNICNFLFASACQCSLIDIMALYCEASTLAYNYGGVTDFDFLDRVVECHAPSTIILPPSSASPQPVIPLDVELRGKLEEFVRWADLQLPPCMPSCSPFAAAAPHCWWCPALECVKNECVRPCQRALMRAMQDLLIATRMLERGWVATRSIVV